MNRRYEAFLPRHPGVITSMMAYDDGFLRLDGLGVEGGTVLSLAFDEVVYLRCCDAVVHPDLARSPYQASACLMIDTASAIKAWLAIEYRDKRDLALAKHYIAFIGKQIFDVVALEDPTVTDLSH